ncbi:membrane protein [Heyndrickxia sporothermodurans]|nr:membrane protein [Heyndrickxia sporothermodurans]
MMIEQLITSFIATGAFGIIFNIPRKKLLLCGLVGMIGWFIYVLLINSNANAAVASLVAAFVIAVISQIFAKIYKAPIIIFSVSGIIPLVPGGLSYDAMRHFVANDYNTAIQLAARAFMISGAIAIGIVFAEVINQMIKKISPKSKKMYS